MYIINSKVGKQVLAWALVFTLVLSTIPSAIGDEDDDEYFYSIEETLSDEDGDGSDDTITIGYDSDTSCDCWINITVIIDIYDVNFIESINETYAIYNGYGDYEDQSWDPEYNGTFDFYVSMYDEWGNFEDSWNVTDIELRKMSGSPDETINVGNFVYDNDDDDLPNDMEFRAAIKDEPIEGVEFNVEFFNGLVWTYYTNGTTDGDGFFMVLNATDGEYRYDAEFDGEELEDETISYTEVDVANNLSHDIILLDLDDADDYDDIGAILFEDGDTVDNGYVEIFDDSGDLFDSGYTDTDYYGYTIYALNDVEKGNYTYDFYRQENGELLQSGWLHSYGSTHTNHDEWFEDWEYATNDTNGDGEANSIVVKYDPNTECNCTIEIEVDFSVYNNDTGSYADSDYYYHEINGTQVDSFETDEWSPSKNGNYTFEFYLYDDSYNYEDEFNFTVYLECDQGSNNTCDNNEWFEDWDYDTESTDSDNLDDTINIDYNPHTDCDCEVGVYVYMEVYENVSRNWLDSESRYHVINGTDEEYFFYSWTSSNSTSYDFYVYMYDENWNFEDQFLISNIYLYQKSGAGGPGDDDEYFDWIDAYTYDDDNDGYNDTVELDYDPDTTCECNVNVTFYVDAYDNETGAWVNGTEEEYTIYHDDNDYWYKSWSPEYNGTFDFYVELYDEDGNLEDEREYLGIELHTRTSGGGGGSEDEDEWFWGIDWDVDQNTIEIGYDPDTTCDCTVDIIVYIDVYLNSTGEYLDYVYANHTIDNGYSDWFTQDWTSWNDDYYDFHVYMYDEEYNFEDEFWIYDEYLGSDGSGGNGSDDGNGIGHLASIEDWEEDGFVNDFIGGVLEDDALKEDAYFEIYDANGNLVDSGNPNYVIPGYGALFISYNLSEAEYTHYVFYEENDVMLQAGNFYSYGDTTSQFEVINVENAVFDDDEYSVYDDVAFNAHQGDFDEGVEGVEIVVYVWNDEEEMWYDHAYLETNETGEAWLYNEECGQYEWEVYTDGIDESGFYEVTAGCDSDDNTNDEDHDEWFNSWDYHVYAPDSVEIFYDPDTTNMNGENVTVYMDIYNGSGYYVGSYSREGMIYGNESDNWTEFFTADYSDEYDFELYIYDADNNFEDYVSILGVYLEVNSAPEIYGINTQELSEGQIFTFEADVYDEEGDELEYMWDMGDGSEYGTESPRHVYQDDGQYEIALRVFDGNQETEAFFDVNVINLAPTLEISYDDFGQEGQILSFTSQSSDVSEDTVEVTWSFPDGTQAEGNFAQYMFVDDGDFIIGVTAEDEDGGKTSETVIVTIENVAPTFTEFQMPSGGQEGETLDFKVGATDPGEDTIVFNIDFGDGTTPLITQDGGNISHRFAEGDTFTVVVCAKDEDGGENCRQHIIPVSLLEQLEDEGLLPGFNLLLAISALGVVGILRRRTH